MEEPVIDVKREFHDEDEDDEQSVDSSTVALNLADADRQSAASDDMAEVRNNTEPSNTSQCPSPSDFQFEMAELPKDKQPKSVASDSDHQQSADSPIPMTNDHHHNVQHHLHHPENHQENHHHRDAENGSSTSSGENRSMTGTLAESLLESSKMALADIALREKRCRVFERESNELKDVICSMNHVVHILENIKRVSRDYIHYLYELIGCTIRQDNDQIEQLQQEILELEAELKQWERKYHVMSSFNASNGSLASIGTAAAFLAGVANNNNNNNNETETSNHGGPNNGGPNNNGTTNNNASSSSASSENQLDHGDDDHLDEHENAESGDIEMETNHRNRSQSASLASNGTNSVGGGVLIPQELCEMSMETQDNDQSANGTVQHAQNNNEVDNVVQSKLASSSSSSVINQRAAQHNNRATQQARAAAAAAAAAAAFIMNPTGTHHSAASSPLIAAAMAAASAASASSDKASSQQHKLNTLNSLKQQFKSSLNSSSGSNVSTSQSSHDNRHNGIVPNGHNNSASASAMTNGGNQPVQITSKPLFLCDHPGCNYQTNMRQRLAMHKRAHAGEMLFSCDISGCGYQSNYKGNIKIHKKHRHRIESGGEQSSYLVTDNNGNNQKFRTRGRKRKANQIVPPGMMSSSQSSSAAGHQLVMSSIRGQQLDMMKSFMGGGRPSVIVGEEGVEAFTEDGQNSSGEMYSGNESGAKESDMPLYHCTVDGCHYRSKWKQCLTAHQFLHAGVKPYKCDYPGCNYRTNFKGNVNVHKRVHRASEFQCKFAGCSFSTPWKNSFMIHQRNHLPSVVPTPSSAITPVKGTTNTPISGLGPQSNGPIDSDVPLSLSMGGRRRVEAPWPNMSIEARSTSTRLINIDSPTLPSIESLNGGALPTTAENILNGLNALHQSQSQTSSRTMSATTMSSLMANGHFINGHRMKQEEDDDDVSLDEDEEDEIDDDEDEEMMMTFGGEHGNSSETAAANHAFLMAEAASAVVSQASAVHLAALRHSVNSAQNDSLRAGMMFDLSRYHQEMI